MESGRGAGPPRAEVSGPGCRKRTRRGPRAGLDVIEIAGQRGRASRDQYLSCVEEGGGMKGTRIREAARTDPRDRARRRACGR